MLSKVRSNALALSNNRSVHLHCHVGLIGNTDSWLGLKIVGRENHTATGFDAFEYEYSDGTPVSFISMTFYLAKT